MASDGPPGTDQAPSDLGTAIAALNSWTHRELQTKLAEIGAPTMGKEKKGRRRAMLEEGLCLANSS